MSHFNVIAVVVVVSILLLLDIAHAGVANISLKMLSYFKWNCRGGVRSRSTKMHEMNSFSVFSAIYVFGYHSPKGNIMCNQYIKLWPNAKWGVFSFFLPSANGRKKSQKAKTHHSNLNSIRFMNCGNSMNGMIILFGLNDFISLRNILSVPNT